MKKPKKLKKFKPASNISAVTYTIFILLLATVGVYFLTTSHATTPYAAISADSGTLSGGATIVTDPSASNGKDVQFGSTSKAIAGNLPNFLEDFDSTDYNWATVAPQYSVIELNAWNYDWIPAIKAANPNVKVLEYKDLNSARPSACSLESSDEMPAGVGYCWAKANDPSWFLTGQSSSQNSSNCGGTMAETGYSDNCETDPGNPAYQQQWLTNVIQDAQAHGWDGVIMDNAIDNGSYGYSTQYPTDAAIQASIISMIKVVGPALQAHGLIAVANMGGYSTEYPNFWGELLPYLNGGMQEFYLSWDGNPDVTTTAGWQVYENEIALCASENKLYCQFHAGQYGTTTQQTINYTAASLLLYTDGNSSYFEGNYGSYTTEPNLGAATDTAHQVGNNWVRDFQHGTVTVNVAAGTGSIVSN